MKEKDTLQDWSQMYFQQISSAFQGSPSHHSMACNSQSIIKIQKKVSKNQDIRKRIYYNNHINGKNIVSQKFINQQQKINSILNLSTFLMIGNHLPQ